MKKPQDLKYTYLGVELLYKIYVVLCGFYVDALRASSARIVVCHSSICHLQPCCAMEFSL